MKNKKIKFYVLTFIMPILLFMLVLAITNHYPFGKYLVNIYDSYFMYPSLLVHTIRSFKEGSWFFSFFGGMGVDFYNIRSLYMNSPLNLLFCFFSEKNVFLFYILLMILRIGLSALTMSILLNYFSNNKEKYSLKNFLFSLIYSFTTYSIACSIHIMWMDTYVLLPLVIMGLEKMLNGEKANLYILFLSIMIIINFYIGFMVCIFLVIYFIYKALILNKFNWKYIKKFLFASIVSGLISGFIIVPAFFSLLGGRADSFNFSNLGGIDIKTLYSSFHNMMPASYVITNNMYGGTLSYCTLFVLVLNILFFFNTKISKKEKMITLFIFIFFFMGSFIKIIDYAWNMFQPPVWWQHRYYFVVLFFNILVAYKSYNCIKDVRLSHKNKCVILFVASILSFISMLCNINQMLLLPSYYLYLFYVIALLIFVVFLFWFKQKKLIFVLLIFELLFNSIIVMNSFKLETIADAKKRLNEINSFNTLKSFDSSFYRISEVDENSADNSFLFGYNSDSAFSSSYNKNVVNFYENTRLSSTNKVNYINVDFKNPALISLLNIKYIYGQSYYFNSVNKDFYVNEESMEMGYSVPESYKKVKISSDYKENINNIYSSLYGNKVKLFYDIEKYVKIQHNNLEYDSENYFIPIEDDIYDDDKYTEINLEFVATHDGILFPRNLSVLNAMEYIVVNNKKYEFYDNSDKVIYVKKGDKIEVNYKYETTSVFYTYLLNENSYFLDIIDIDFANKILKKMKKNDSVDNVIVKKGKIYFDIDATKDETLFLSIPYNDGYNIKIDGKKVEYFKLLDSFIGIDIEKGNHDVFIDYKPKGFVLGIVISLIGILVFLIYNLYFKMCM